MGLDLRRGAGGDVDGFQDGAGRVRVRGRGRGEGFGHEVAANSGEGEGAFDSFDDGGGVAADLINFAELEEALLELGDAGVVGAGGGFVEFDE